MLQVALLALALGAPEAAGERSDQALVLGGRVAAGAFLGMGAVSANLDPGAFAGLRLGDVELTLELGALLPLDADDFSDSESVLLGARVARRFRLSSSVQLSVAGRGGVGVPVTGGLDRVYVGGALGLVLPASSAAAFELVLLDARAYFTSSGDDSTPNATVALQAGLRVAFEIGL